MKLHSTKITIDHMILVCEFDIKDYNPVCFHRTWVLSFMISYPTMWMQCFCFCNGFWQILGIMYICSCLVVAYILLIFLDKNLWAVLKCYNTGFDILVH